MCQIKHKLSTKWKITIFLCCLVFLVIGIVPAWAGGVADLIVVLVSGILNLVAKLILAILESVSTLFLGAMNADVDTLVSHGFLKGFEVFSEGIRILAVALATLSVGWQLFTVFWGPLIGVTQTQPIGSIIGRALVFIPLTYGIQSLAMTALKQIQLIYGAFLSVYQTNPDGIFSVQLLSSYINAENFMDDLNIPATNLLDATLHESLSVILACLLMIVITWQFIQLLLETAQRFVAMIFYVYLSPLAAACGVGPNSMNIAKTGLTLFLSSSVLWILNVWSVSIVLSLFSSVGNAVAGGCSDFFIWAMVTYGAVKIAQQLDDIFNAVGATNVRLSGNMLSDILAMSKFYGFASKSISGIRDSLTNFAEHGAFSSEGHTADKPLQPKGDQIKTGQPGATLPDGSAQKQIDPNTRLPGSQNAPSPELKTTPAGGTPKGFKEQAGSAALDFAGKTAVGKFARGVAKTGENIGARVNASMNEAKDAADNRALTDVYTALNQETPTARADAVAQLAVNNPGALENQSVKDYLGNAMGLAPNQRLTSLSVDKNGNLSGRVATQTKDGVSVSKVSGMNDMFANGTGMGTQRTAGSAEAMGQPVTTLHYQDGGGAQKSASVQRGSAYLDDNLNRMTNFSVVPNEGGQPINVKAPTDMKEAEVASLVGGTASAETVNKFTSNGGDMISVMGAAAGLDLDPSRPASVDMQPLRTEKHADGTTWTSESNVRVGTAANATNIPRSNGAEIEPTPTHAAIGYTDTNGNAYEAILHRGQTTYNEDGTSTTQFNLAANDANGTGVSFNAPSSMTDTEVANIVAGSADRATMQKFMDAGGNTEIAGAVASGLHMGPENQNTVRQVTGSDSQTAISYTNSNGESHEAHLVRGATEVTEDGHAVSSFNVISNDAAGTEVSFKAPTVMTDAEIGSIVAGTADHATLQKFTDAGGNAEISSTVANGLNFNPDSVSSVSQVPNYDTQTAISYTNSSGVAEEARLYRGAEFTGDDGKTMAHYDVVPSNADAPEVSFVAPAGMTDTEVAAYVSGTADQATIDKFNLGGGDAQAADAVVKGLDIQAGNVPAVSQVPAYETQTAISYQDSNGDDREAYVYRSESHVSSNGQPMSEFSFVSNDGETESHIMAPSNMTNREVASVVSGTADDATMQKFTQYGGSLEDVRDAAAGMDLYSDSQASVSQVPLYKPFDESEAPCIEFTYPGIGPDNSTVVQDGYMKAVSMTPNGQIRYEYGTSEGAVGNIELNANLDPNEIAMAIMDKSGGEIGAIKRVQRTLGMKNAHLNESEQSMLQEALGMMKNPKKYDPTSEDAPLTPEPNA